MAVTTMTKATNNKAYEFCKKSIRRKTTPKYVKLQMRDFMRIAEGKNKKYVVSEQKIRQMENILKILIMPKGLKAGQSLYECTTGYQWLFYTAILCTVYRDNPKKRRYETGVLEICRKNFKTYTIATIFILLFLTEPKFSKFFSVAPDGALSREIREAIAETIRSSPLVYEYKENKRFKILRDYILFKPTQIQYIPLSYSTSRMDGRLPNAFIADEVGALPNSYAINAMQSGQLNILNKLGFIISTKYPTIDNPFEDEVAYSKKVLDKIEKDDTRFSLLYEPDETKGWETDDLILKQSNPVALEIPEIWEDLLKKRAYAIAVDSARENFVTKHCNIIYQGVGTETYVDAKDVRDCKVAHIDWEGRVVYLGLDLSETNDNTSVAMMAVDDDNNILAESFAFIPEGRIAEKTITEKVNYQELLKTGKVFACGDRVIDYGAVEEFILGLEDKYGVQIQAIGYDRYNAISTAQKLERAGYNTVEIRQHSSVLHPPTKFLKEKILSKEFQYENNKLLEINFQNARCTYDTNRNQYVSKKKSNGKVDMVVSLIDAMYLVQQDVFLNQMDFTIQVL
ncbi:terminase TerL endonuclease subunit [Megamonas hypermegale]|uniref:terminase TerL endonuclease subunit n=1 Tax=Megamonas hypermegale TaxID=158847 RepID=UPI0026EDA1C8|nr:terminase TerL endonuclease subunit [Megamonas hypermegale]